MPVNKSRKEVDNIPRKDNEANKKYKKKTYKTYQLRLRKDNEKNIIDKMESLKNQKNSYLKSLILKDIEK